MRNPSLADPGSREVSGGNSDTPCASSPYISAAEMFATYGTMNGYGAIAFTTTTSSSAAALAAGNVVALKCDAKPDAVASVVAVAKDGKKALPLRIKEMTGSEVRYHEPNSPEPFAVESERIHNGRAILKVRTSLWDRKWENPYVEYFKGRQRMLEIMVQTQFKEITPEDRVYIGVESTKPMKLNNIFSQAIAKAVMALIEATVPFSHTTMGEDGRENCCLVFPLDSTADRFIATPPGETPPPLGVAMFDDKYAPEKRPKFGGVYEENWSYSFSFHSMYVDLVRWKLVNLPTFDDVSLNTFLKGMPLRFVGYTLPKSHRGPHRQSDKKYLFAFELENDRHKA